MSSIRRELAPLWYLWWHHGKRGLQQGGPQTFKTEEDVPDQPMILAKANQRDGTGVDKAHPVIWRSDQEQKLGWKVGRKTEPDQGAP